MDAFRRKRSGASTTWIIKLKTPTFDRRFLIIYLSYMRTILLLLILVSFTAGAQISSRAYALQLCGYHHNDSLAVADLSGCSKVEVINKETGEVLEEVKILGGTMIVSGVPGAGAINSHGDIDSKSQAILREVKVGQTITVEIKYTRLNGTNAIQQIKLHVV